jgi:GGDEF domain-containing protein/CHASE3 domain sensor protein
LKKFIHSLFRPRIIKKIFYGYFSLALLIVIISVFTLSSLQRLNALNEDIINRDALVIETTESMLDNLFAQELFARRYLIMNSPDILALFEERGREFERMTEKIHVLAEYSASADRIESVHAEYNDLILKLPLPPVAEEYNAKVQKKQNELISLVKELSNNAKYAQHTKMRTIERIGSRALKFAGILCGTGIILSIGATLLITRSISRSVNKLKHATEEISSGKFEYVSDIKNRDELGDLSRSFTEMAKRLKLLEEVYLDTNPLTHLPGGVAVEKAINKRTDSGVPSAFCFVDLDNFKAFNDRYSYAKGSEIIMTTARIIEKVVSEAGTGKDFIGHIGGDDFIFITSPERYAIICDAIIKRFDNQITGYYDLDDRKRGHIISKNRQGQEMQFPIMTISIAVVNNERGIIKDHIRIGEIAAELKEYAKSLPGSVCVVDRRQETGSAENVIQFPRRSG